MKALISGAFLWALVAFPCYGASVTGSMKCSQVAKIFNDKNASGAVAVMKYVNNEWETLDDNHMEAGDPGIMAQMSDKARLSNEIVVPAWCESHSAETLHSAADEIYEGIREMSLQLGLGSK